MIKFISHQTRICLTQVKIDCKLHKAGIASIMRGRRKKKMQQKNAVSKIYRFQNKMTNHFGPTEIIFILHDKNADSQ